jgi:putative MFS transporter
MTTEVKKSTVVLTVVVAALGYFVDMYDLVLYGIVRISSLQGIGVLPNEMVDTGILILNMQMGGMLTGGIFWGILGDKKGRLSVLFGSIVIYSLANIANGFVVDVTQYSIIRFFAGFGLAGELGAAITLVSEILPTEKRGYGTTIVASVGIFGAVVAGILGDWLPWRTTYIIGGSLGLVLLLLRLKMLESGIFNSIKSSNIKRGNFLALFTSRKLFFKYINCILIGLPIWYSVGILITFSPEFAKVLEIDGHVSAGRAIMFTYIGITLGDILSGLISQFLKSRKKTLYIFISLTSLMIFIYLFLSHGINSYQYYTICVFMGIGVGYWAVFVTVGSEQFGTNIRATVTTTVPNFIRGSVIPITLAFNFVKDYYGFIYGATIIGIITIIISLISLYYLEETFTKDLNYIENL